ncbi:MAG TPA: hypothetical protein VG326_20370 [Tepidisphaeraceae bacterium]|nr:hypothetical protein [Tepidisphaeraceae bacterium]
MLQSDQVEELVCLISSFDRRTVTRHLVDFHAGFPVDFTPEFLESQTVERLRHLLFALCMQCHHVLDLPAVA